MSVKSEIRKIAKKVTILYKKELQRKKLIDTGNLLRSFETNITIDRKLNLDISIKSMDYFQYLDEEYQVSEDVLNSKAYLKIEDELITLITASMFIDLPKEFKSSDSVSYTFKFKNLK